MAWWRRRLGLQAARAISVESSKLQTEVDKFLAMVRAA